MGYRFLEHTADVMIEAFGSSIGEAFSFAAKAMFEVMLDVSKVKPRRSVRIKVSANDLEGLLYSWLEELLFRFDVHRTAFSEFRFSFDRNKDILIGKGEAAGEPYDPVKHSRRKEVKAITFSNMLVSESGCQSKVRFILDI